MATIDAVTAGGQNIIAFLDMLAGVNAEDTARIAGSDDGYMVIVGGGLFTSYADHPRQMIHLKDRNGNPILRPDGTPLISSAAGRYQQLEHNFDVYRVQLDLPDFSPLSQDLIAIQEIRECRAIAPLQNGDITSAIQLCSSRWASLPGNSYGQRQGALAALTADYEAAGGTVM